MPRLFAALMVGLISQVVALACFIMLAAKYPQGSLKYAGFFILTIGSVFALMLLSRMNVWWRLSVPVFFSICAPLMLLFFLPKAREMLDDVGAYIGTYIGGVGIALIYYFVLLGVIQLFVYLNAVARGQ